MKNEFKARLWKNKPGDYVGSFVRKPLGAYYCSGEFEIKNQDLCVNLPDDDGQIVINTESVIKLLKKHGRI